MRQDLVIELSRVLLDAHDGLTLEYGLKGFAGKSLRTPIRDEDQPARENLAIRYDQFRRAG